MEEFMMQALDGTISKADRDRLNAYLDIHRDEREMFESMVQAEMLLRNLPVTGTPLNFANNVMTAVGHARIASKPSPTLNGSQVMTLFFTCTISAIMLLVICATIFSVLTTYAAPQLHITVVFLRNLVFVGRDALNVIAAFARFAVNQPLVWGASALGGLVVVIWLRLLAGLWLPTRYQPTLA